MDLGNKTTSEFRTVLTAPWVSLIPRFHCILFYVFMLSPSALSIPDLSHNLYCLNLYEVVLLVEWVEYVE